MTLHHAKPSKRRGLALAKRGRQRRGRSLVYEGYAGIRQYLAPAFAPSPVQHEYSAFHKLSDSWIAPIEPGIQGVERWVLYCLDTTAAKQNIRGAATAPNKVYEA